MGRVLTKPMREAWARVRIHLNDRNAEAARRAAVEASEITDWDRFGPSVRYSSAAEVFTTDELPLGWCWFEPTRYRLLIPRATLAEHGMNYWMANYMGLIRGLRASCFRSYRSEDWHELDALDDVVRAHDPYKWD